MTTMGDEENVEAPGENADSKAEGSITAAVPGDVAQPTAAGAEIASSAVLPPVDDETDESAYKVSLPSFHGPLDLLLHLIRQHKIDIYDIPILLITEQYTAYLDAMEELDLEVAADYVYMAALLIHIKSKMLLPRDESAETGENPHADLVNRLREYHRYKAGAETVAERAALRMAVWPRPATPS